MRFKENTPVVTADDHRIGDVARVVLDPRNREVTAIIVRQGFLFTEDRVVPVALIESAEGGEVRLRATKAGLPDLQPLEEQHFVPVDEDEDSSLTAPDMPQPMYSYPPVGMGWSGMDYPTYWPPLVKVETERHIPPGSIVLNEGARVVSADGHHAGNVEEIITDSESGQATHLVLAAGRLFTSRKLIPTIWIGHVDDEIRLSVSRRTLERLPDYAPRR